MMTIKKRILVVDDDKRITYSIKSYLERFCDCSVLEVHDPAIAMDVARRFRPDLIVLDIAMPGKDGGDVAKEMRSHPELEHIPISFLTGMVRKDEQPRCARGQMEHLVSKSLPLNEIAWQVQRPLCVV